jgi:hypothetical protein
LLAGWWFRLADALHTHRLKPELPTGNIRIGANKDSTIDGGSACAKS